MQRLISVTGAAIALLSGAAMADMADHKSCATPASESISITQDIIAEAVSLGDVCEHSVAVIILREGDGAPVYSFASATRFLFGFDDVEDQKGMADALDEWLGVPSVMPVRLSSTMPDWEEWSDSPGAEFPFYLEEWVDRTEYERLRAADLPLWCHVQGRESMACLIVEDGTPYKIGVQSFPG